MSCLLARRLYLFWDCVIASSCADHCPSVQVSPWQRLGVHKNVNKYLWHWWLNSSLSTLWAFNLSWFGVFECPLEWQVFYKSAAKGQRRWNYWIYIPLIVKWIRNMILQWARFDLGSSELMARKLTTEPRQRPNAGPVRMTDCEGDFFCHPICWQDSQRDRIAVTWHGRLSLWMAPICVYNYQSSWQANVAADVGAKYKLPKIDVNLFLRASTFYELLNENLIWMVSIDNYVLKFYNFA